VLWGAKTRGHGRTGEEDAFKLMLWKGQVLFGMMMVSTNSRALDYLASVAQIERRQTVWHVQPQPALDFTITLAR